MATERINNEMDEGNLKLPPLKDVLMLIFDTWVALFKEMIKESLTHYNLCFLTEGLFAHHLTCSKMNPGMFKKF